MAIHIFALKLGIELLRDRPRQLIFLLEYVFERGIPILRVRLALLIEALRG
jgi:hypothetical protein